VEVFPNTLEEARLIPMEVRASVIYLNSPGNRLGRPLIPWQELEDMGYKMVLDSTTGVIAPIQAVRDAFSAYLREGRPQAPQASAIELRKWVETLIGLPDYYRIEAETTERGRGRRCHICWPDILLSWYNGLSLWDLCLGPQGRRQDRLGQAAILSRRSPPRFRGPLVIVADGWHMENEENITCDVSGLLGLVCCWKKDSG